MYTYRAVSIKVLGDHKVYSAVVLSFPGIDLTRVPVADSGGVRGVQMHPPLAASDVFFCVYIN